MDTFKKNWGFIVISLLCFLLVAAMVIKCGSTNEKLAQSKSEYEKKVNYLDGVGKKKLKLTDENVKIATNNSDITTKGIQQVHMTLMQRFKLNYKVPGDGASALRELKEAILQMQKQLDEKEIAWDSKVEYFSFENIAKSATLPQKDDLPLIFRQLAIVRQVVKIAIDNKVSAINEIKRPMNLRVHEEAEYTLTPIEITVTASPENGQNFVNSMSSQENYLFFLRTIEIKAPDVATAAIKSMFSIDLSSMDMDAGFNDIGRGRNRKPVVDNRPKPGTKGSEDGLVDVPLRRQELLVFDKKDVYWKLRFDLIEPKYELPEEKKAEEE